MVNFTFLTYIPGQEGNWNLVRFLRPISGMTCALRCSLGLGGGGGVATRRRDQWREGALRRLWRRILIGLRAQDFGNECEVAFNVKN
ncbi:hypothetical protein TNCV_4642161 [Trichonephila clavipes]|nr:hypothetical protein TNCV_4642161 [Trichonephila clavipes]